MKTIHFTLKHLVPCAAAVVLLTNAAGSQGAEVASLPSVVDEIISSNPELRFYEAEIEAARAAAKAASSREAPELSIEVGRRRLRDSAGILEGEGAAWAASITQTFDWPGRIGLRKAVANKNVELAQLGVERLRTALAARAVALTHGLSGAAEKAAAIREVADRFAALKETFLARDPAGITPLLETRVIEASELALQRRATEAELEAQRALVELNQLWGVPIDSPLKTKPARFVFGPAPAHAELVSAAREKNFEYRLRRLELEQQGFAVSLAKNERYPSISVSPYVSRSRAGETESTYGVGVSIPLPLAQRGRAGLEGAKARQRQAEAALAMAERDLERELVTIAAEFSAKSTEAKRWSPNTVAQFKESAALADRHYRLGAVPIATYIELQMTYLDAVEALIDTEREAIEAGLKLQLLTGLNFKAVETVNETNP